MKAVEIHTDGACAGNPGPGGWAAILRHGQHMREIRGAEPATTNNRMELQAAIGALHVLKEPCQVTLHTDSAYLKDGITQWIHGWKARGWVTKDRKAVKNEDLWRELDRLASQHRVSWKWLKGHAGHPDNERCDELAVAAIANLREQFTPHQLQEKLSEFSEAQSGHNRQKALL